MKKPPQTGLYQGVPVFGYNFIIFCSSFGLHFTDIGLDILNPIQPLAKGMDADFLKKTYGDKLSFFGGIDVQKILPTGSPDEVKKHVQDKISILGKGGGYILAPAHNIQDDTPVENILAIFESVK